MSAPKLFLVTYGCQMNEYDSAKMADVLGRSHGYARTENPDEADMLLVNTCSVREKAEEKVFSLLGRWRQLKEENPNLVIGVGGFLGIGEREVAVNFSSLRFTQDNSGATVVALNATKDALKAAPEWKWAADRSGTTGIGTQPGVRPAPGTTR